MKVLDRLISHCHKDTTELREKKSGVSAYYLKYVLDDNETDTYLESAYSLLIWFELIWSGWNVLRLYQNQQLILNFIVEIHPTLNEKNRHSNSA